MSVDWKPKRGLWRARISLNGHRFDLGEFKTEAEARDAYDTAHMTFAHLRITFPRTMRTMRERFLSKTQPQENGCIYWTGQVSTDGYGKFQINGAGKQRHMRAHRVAYFLTHGKYPDQFALHSCDTPLCVNPDHLEDGDQLKNVRDCVARGRHRSGNRKAVAL